MLRRYYAKLGLPNDDAKKAIVESEALISNLDQLGSEVPDSKRRARTFEPMEAVKLVPVNPTCSNDRVLRVSATLDSK